MDHHTPHFIQNLQLYGFKILFDVKENHRVSTGKYV